MVFTREEWQAIVDPVLDRGLLLIYWSLMEGIVFDGQSIIHPVSFAGAGKDDHPRVGQHRVPDDRLANRLGTRRTRYGRRPWGRPHLQRLGSQWLLPSRGTCRSQVGPGGLPLRGRRIRTTSRYRRAATGRLPGCAAAGGWALLLETEAMGIAPAEASARLLTQKVAATPMTVWGESKASRYIRFAFSREPVERLQTLGGRVRAALG